MPLRCMAYSLQKPFHVELKRLQKQDIIAPLGVDDTSEWCNNFGLVPKANGNVMLCLDQYMFETSTNDTNTERSP